MPKRKIALGETLLGQRLAVTTCHDALRRLAQDVALSSPLRDQAAAIALALARLGRSLAAEAETTVHGGGA